MRRPPEDIDIKLVEPDGGFDPNRLSLALRMLISEKDIIEYIRRSRSNNRYPDHTPTDTKPTSAPPGSPNTTNHHFPHHHEKSSHLRPRVQ